MTSEKQAASNRRNSSRSTGPTTRQGKRQSSQNALTHGLLAQAAVVHGETVDAFDKFRKELFADRQPEGAMEALLVEKIANYAWRLRRAVRAEAVMMQTGLTQSYSPKTLDAFFEGWDGKKMNNIARYEAMLARHFYRAMSELRALQCSRQAQTTTAASDTLDIGFVS